jgi:hypothetical protein
VPELEQVLAQAESWLVFLETEGSVEPFGKRALPPKA